MPTVAGSEELLGVQDELRVMFEHAPPQHFPYKKIHIPDPAVSARAVYLWDPSVRMTLYELNADQKLPVASLAKVLTALVAEDLYSLEEFVTVPADIQTIFGSQIHLMPGERLQVYDLLRALLIPSGNDAAYTLAAGSSLGYQGFVKRMNDTAVTLGLHNTQVINPIGYDYTGQYSSARDMGMLTAQLLVSSTLSEIVQTKSTHITTSDGKRYTLQNTNELLSLPEVTGVKTGTSNEAGENLIVSWVHDNRTLIGVILGSTDRTSDAKALMRWVGTNFVW